MKSKRKILEALNKILQSIFKALPLQNRAFFYSIRADGKALGNLSAVLDVYHGKKKCFLKTLPHSVFKKPMIYYYLLTSKVIVSDDYIRYLRFTKLRKEQKVLQLWHACGAFKKFALHALPENLHEHEKLVHRQYSAICVSSEYVRDFYAGAFGVSRELVKAIGIPRTDSLLDTKNIHTVRHTFFEKHGDFKGKKIILYCPTFREENNQRVPFNPDIDWDKLDKNLKDEVFIIKRHPTMTESFLGKSYKNIVDLSAVSISTLMVSSDLLITDYSSVIFEAALINLPLLFYAPDKERFERGFYLNFPEDLPAPLICSSGELLTAARAAMENPDTGKIRAFKEKYMSACDGKAAKRAAEMILKFMNSF